MQKRGLEMSCLDEVIAIFAFGDVLDEKYSDHALGGD
jgi:mRNA-degrading endonuclease YafQ of YafQ-DinJ toxin-antitoxin module